MKSNCLRIILVFICMAGTAFGKNKYHDKESSDKSVIALLYQKLEYSAQKGILFGHQDALAYGLGWKNNGLRFKSDVNRVCGKFPAIYGWDIGHLEMGSSMNLDSVDFDFMKKMIVKVHEKGGSNTISWHLNEPVNGGSSWTEGNRVPHILPGGSHHQVFQMWLGRLAHFFLSLKDSEGELVPILFRPYHEMNGSWFWWGGDNCSPDDYKKLWIMTKDILENKFGVTNLLYVYSPNSYSSETEFMLRYPGDDYVDILGLDIYDREGDDEKYVKPLRVSLKILKQIANQRNKLYALTETGRDQVPEQNWWTDKLYPNIKDEGLAWVLVWRNAWPSHYYGPYPGQISEKDFCVFSDKSDILFLDDWVQLQK